MPKDTYPVRAYKFAVYPCRDHKRAMMEIALLGNDYYNSLIALHNQLLKGYPTKAEFKEMSKENAAAHRESLSRRRKEGSRTERATATSKGLYYGTYILIEDAVKRATNGTREAHFQGFANRRSFRIGCSVNNGDSLRVVDMGTKKSIALEARGRRNIKLPNGAVLRPPSGSVLNRCRHILTFYHRGPRADPLQMLCKMDRPLPRDGVIRQAWLQPVKCKGTHWKWEVVLIISSESHLPPEPPLDDSRKVVGMDLGWRELDDKSHGRRIRVAYFSDGYQVTTPPGLIERFEHASKIQGLADDLTLNAWKLYIGEIPLGRDKKPLPVGALAKKLTAMSVGRFDITAKGDGDLAQRIYTGWWEQYRHLRDWAAAEREKAIRYRKQHYFMEANAVCQKYRRIHLEKLRIDHLAPTRVGGSRRVIAAPSEWVACLKAVAYRRWTQLPEQPAKDSTRECYSCGTINRSNLRERMMQCEGCGEIVDQDWNASNNLLRRGEAAEAVKAAKSEKEAKKEMSLAEAMGLPEPAAAVAQDA